MQEIKLHRRNLFGILAAAPVAASAAAAKMGLASTTSAAATSMPPMFGAPMSEASWLQKSLSSLDLMPDWKLREIKEHSRIYSRILDPDLASMRSVSASAAYMFQRGRYESSAVNRERQYISDQIARNAGF